MTKTYMYLKSQSKDNTIFRLAIRYKNTPAAVHKTTSVKSRRICARWTHYFKKIKYHLID